MQSILQWIRRAKLKDWLRLLDRILPHVAIVISGMLIVFFLIDRVNKPMAFMTNEFHKRITFVLAIMSIYLAVRRCAQLRAQEREEWSRRQRRPQSPQPNRRPSETPRYSDSPRYSDTYPRRTTPRYTDDYPRRTSAYNTRRETPYRSQSDYEPRYTNRR